MTHRSLAEIFLSQVERYGSRVVYSYARNGHWEECTWDEALLCVREIALGLLSLGVRKGDRVAIFSANRVEWSLVDWADICIGALTVPIYASSTPSQAGRIVEHSGSTILFMESAERLAKIDLFHPSLSSLKKIVLFEGAGNLTGRESTVKVISLGELRALGRRGNQEDFYRLARSLQPEDDLTIIYTSGTTGEPKGVLTTHGHYLFMINAVMDAIPASDRDVVLQFLPFAHSFGRLEHFVVVALGLTCGFARSLETIGKDLLVIRPTLLFSVPRVYENAYDRIRSRVAKSGLLRRAIFGSALELGRRCSRYRREGRKVPPIFRLALSLARRLVFSPIHSSFGGRLRAAVSGGAPLAPEIAEFFDAIGLLVLEGYGLTETSTVSHVNRLDRYKFGTVGLPLKGVECRIGSDGEILLRGPNIFKGYYRDEGYTMEAIDAEGWLHSGDIGEIDSEGFLRITDRKKDLIVTSGGKKVAPQMIENLLKTDAWISQAMVMGDRQRHIVALITLKADKIDEWAKAQGLEFRDPQEIASHPRILSLVKEKIRQKNKELAPFEAVRSFRILPHDFSVEKEELTPTLKLRRQVVRERYKDLIDEMIRKPQVEI